MKTDMSSFLHGLTKEILEVKMNFPFVRVALMSLYVESKYDPCECCKSSKSRHLSGGMNVPASVEEVIIESFNPPASLVVYLALVYIVLLTLLINLLFIYVVL